MLNMCLPITESRFIQPLWINYMLNLNPLTGCEQSDTHIVLVKGKSQTMCLCTGFSEHSSSCVYSRHNRPAGQDDYSQFWWWWTLAFTSWLGCGGGSFFFFLFPVSNFQAAPVTSSLDFHSFLLSLFAFFLILVLRFIRGNTCPPKDGLYAVTD